MGSVLGQIRQLETISKIRSITLKRSQHRHSKADSVLLITEMLTNSATISVQATPQINLDGRHVIRHDHLTADTSARKGQVSRSVDLFDRSLPLAGLRRVALNGWSAGCSGHLFGFGGGFPEEAG